LNIFNQPIYWLGKAPIQASLGDKAYLMHVNHVIHWGGPGETSYSFATEAEMTPALSIEMASGVVFDVNGAMTQGTSESCRGNFELSAFGALNSEIAIDTSQSYGYLLAGVAAAPRSAVHGGFPELVDNNRQLGVLAEFDVFPFSKSSPDLDLGDVGYRNGFPADYTKLAYAVWNQPIFFTVNTAGGQVPGILSGAIGMNSLTLPAANRPISPTLGPVTNLSLDFADAFGTQLVAVSLTPTIRWSPPDLGSASFYQVDMLLYTAGMCHLHGCDAPTNVGTFQTQQTSLTLPPGVLMPGSAYVLVVTAKNAVASDLNSAPMRTTYPFAYAETVSQPFMTAGTTPADVTTTSRVSYGPLMPNRKDVSVHNDRGFIGMPTRR
jgi:hypothetical protein